MPTGFKIEVKQGDKYGRLTVVEEVEPRKSPCGATHRMVKCKCDCDGKETIVYLNSLLRGTTKSCGCLQKETVSKRGKKENIYLISKKHGYAIGYTSNMDKFFIDYDDYEKVRKYCWYKNKDGYFDSTERGCSKHVKLHRLIMDFPETGVVDHIDKDKSNNRKSNLRICTIKENCRNRSKLKSNTSGTTGVTWHKRDKKWQSSIVVNYKTIYLGSFLNKEDAIKARLEAEEKYYGEFSPNYKK